MWFAKSKSIPVYNGDPFYLCFFPSLFLSSSLASLFMFLDGNQSVSECWARLASLDPGSH